MSRSILLAEDNEDDVFFFKAAARKAGWTHEIVVAPNGRDAIETLQQFAAGTPASRGRLSLVLLDLKMPFVTGLEVLEWVRRHPALRFLPIVVLTSSEQEGDIEAAYRLGAASFLVKPSQPEGLGDLVRLIDAYWLRENRLPLAQWDHEARTSVAATS